MIKREEIAAQRKKHYAENRNAITARNVQWKKDNKDKWNAYLREWRAKQKLDKKEQKGEDSGNQE